MSQKKKCSKCGKHKSLDEFNNRSASSDGKTSQCRLCLNTKAMHIRATKPHRTRRYNLKSRFNISVDDYNKMFLKQRGVCKICSNPETDKDSNGKLKWLVVDHNHKTGDVRGLLCSACNKGIGLLGDSTKVLENAIRYLKERGSYGKE